MEKINDGRRREYRKCESCGNQISNHLRFCWKCVVDVYKKGKSQNYMKKRKVYVHQMQSASWKNLLPLSAATLVSYAKKNPRISENYDFEIKVLRQSPSEIIKEYVNPDILAFSVYSWNFKQSIEVARISKLKFPGSLIVFGGPMIPNNPNHIKSFFNNYPFIDIIVHGMGEWVFSEILLARLKKLDLNIIGGISYKKGDLIITSQPIYDKNLDELPSPFLDGTFDEILMKYGDKITGALWETNRGCPYNCSFCVQGNSKFSKILTFDKERLYNELEWICKNKIEYLFGTDANFGILPRDTEIAEMLSEFGKKTGYPKFFSINWTKLSSDKMLKIIEILSRGGIKTNLTLSMQSFNEDTLNAIKRRNMGFLEFERLKNKATQKGINTYTELILGLPNETYNSFIHGLNCCMSKSLNHFFVVYLCRLLDASEMADPSYIKKHRIKTRLCRVGFARHGWSNKGIEETEDIVVSTSKMSINEWKKIFTFVNMNLALYNFRLGFFVFNYLREEYSVNLNDLIEYIIINAKDYPTISKVLKIINSGRNAILYRHKSLVSVDFIKDILFEPHEAALVTILNKKEIFYEELLKITKKYLYSKKINFQPEILREIFKFQEVYIPDWKGVDEHTLLLKFNIPQYFHNLCINNRHIPTQKIKTSINIGKREKENAMDFIKSKLTISSFKIENEILKNWS